MPGLIDFETIVCSSFSSREIMTWPSFDTIISLWSRPTVEQCSFSFCTLCATVLGPPKKLQALAYLATIFKVICSPPPPIGGEDEGSEQAWGCKMRFQPGSTCL